MAVALYVVHAEVEPSADANWLAWMRAEHVPQVVQAAGFFSGRMFRDDTPAADGWSRWRIQYDAPDRGDIDRYLASAEVVRLRADYVSRFGNVTRLSRSILVEAP